MSSMVMRLDEIGKPAWIAAMVLGFVIFWPVGLAILAYLVASGRMGCRRSGWSDERKQEWEKNMGLMQEKMARWGRCGSRTDRTGFTPSGNRAFDEYRADTIRRLEEEAGEFREFLERLRHAKDKAEFEQFMADRRRAAQDDAKDVMHPNG